MTTKDFGIDIDFLNGTFAKTELNGTSLELKRITETYDKLNLVYNNEGYWLSNVIDLVDKYTELKNLSISRTLSSDKVKYRAYTRVSSDGFIWDEFLEIDYSTGKMKSENKRYLQIKLELTGEKDEYREIALTFNKTDTSRIKENALVDLDNSLKLKRNFNYKMSRDDSWNDSGKLVSRIITKGTFKKIDSINLTNVENFNFVR
ncbi:hypothetical protein ACFVRU_55190 [Streptomyces sp. NPDC057927]